MQDATEIQSQRFKRYLQIVLFVFSSLVLLSIHTSHTSTFKGTKDERARIVLGAPRPERSDEFLRGSPLQLGQLRGATASTRTPLEFSNGQEYQTSQRNISSQILIFFRTPEVHLDSLLSQVLPIENAFVAKWWILDLLFFTSFPLFLFKLKQPLTSSVLISLAIFFCPPNSWFSYLPSRLIGLCAASCVCYMMALDPPKRIRKNQIIERMFVCLMSIWAARYLVSVAMYPPWGFPIAGVIVGAFLTWLFSTHDFRHTWRRLVQPVLISLVIVALTIASNRTLYKLALSTVYPGNRRSTGGSDSSPFLGGFLSWFMQSDRARNGGFTNPEYAYGPTALIAVILTLIVVSSSQLSLRARARILTLPTFAFVVVALWSQVNFPRVLQLYNPLVLVPAGRASMILGVLILILLGLCGELFLSLPRLSALATSFLIASTFVLAASDSEDRRLLTLGAPSPWVTFVSFAVVATSIWWLLRGRSTVRRFLPLTLFMVGSGILVNPIVVGVGPLAKSDAVQSIRTLAMDAPGLRFASTGFYEDALLIASAVPQLSGQQVLAPNRQTWMSLDTGHQFEDYWNRGQSYVNFAWSVGSQLNIWNPSPDVIQIVIDPCDERLTVLRLGFVVSPSPISATCLTNSQIIHWMEADLFVYKRSTSE